MNTKELIEKQISEAAGYLKSADAYQRQGLHHSTELSLVSACGRLLQIVQNQQAQIEELQQARRDDCAHPAVINDRCAGCGAPWLEVKQ